MLQSGRGHERQGLTLGYVDQEAAERALVAVQAEQDAETIGRILRLYDKSREDAIRHLCGDPEEQKQLGGIGQGLRPSELIAVHWEDVDLDASTLLVPPGRLVAHAVAA